MGSKSSKSSLNRPIKAASVNSIKNQLIANDIACPGCNMNFSKNTLFQIVETHINMCLGIQEDANSDENPVKNFIIGTEKINKFKQVKNQDYIYEKIPLNLQKTMFVWKKIPLFDIDSQKIFSLLPQQIQNLSFQQKNFWFRYELEKRRISWTNGADFMKIEKTNVLMSSLVAYPKVNMHKEVKIEFIGDKVNDAGGLLRQWIHMVVKQIFDEETGIMTITNTDQLMYKLKWDQNLDEQFSSQILLLFGVILGKSIFQKIPIRSYLDRTILRHLTGRPIEIDDVYGFDKGVIYSIMKLYQSWKFLIDNQINGMGLETYFTVNKEVDQELKEIELVQSGKEIIVDDSNKNLYVDAWYFFPNLSIEHFCSEAVKRSLNAIKTGFYKVIPQKLISVFEPFQLEMILYGVPYIDVKDWRENTDYKGQFHPKHYVIEWFWSKVESFDQQKLANLLHFSTGSSRTPIQGFKKMESNRGTLGKFLIQSTMFDKKNPYPKGHTCFNRLELPMYPNQQTLNLYVEAIANSSLDGVFGLD